MLHFNTLHILASILASTSLLFYMAFGYQSLHDILNVFYGIHVYNRYSFTFLECSSTFIAWRDSMYKGISLLWEHNAFVLYFNIMDNITLVFCTIHVTILFYLKRDASAANGLTDLHTFWRFYSSHLA